ncbi:amino acid/polyamine/organocation transporter, APC superfamily [Mucilaginibacter mallensis]|uniref:Amino acid/polyamine/organocation transporter, APC superfamily n=2 Tax=Mucilaginibacter mallensis TaxID=652787 RepID=A0A1H1S3Y3_MUCMA|nr:amino acid/polyamine/organocation transporter, APC superfamily [Mucilaginibacter mallensis]
MVNGLLIKFMSKSIFRTKSVDKILADVASGYSDGEHSGNHLTKALNVKDLTLMGIAAVVGAGIFSTIGEASFHGGPGVTILFVITAITCGFSALCYAEFASRIPVAGSAYTYAYASFGELIAWIIGWDLLMEYAIGNIAVAISWSTYFVNLLIGFGINVPAWLTMDYFSAFKAHEQVQQLTASHKLADITDALKEGAAAWNNAPGIGDFKLIANIPALLIVVIITYLVYVGIKETKRATNGMVILKIAIVIGVIVVGFFYVTPANWHPFMPNGFGGVMKGVSGVFFAYIGFDAISTTAEECQNPQRDLPRGMIYSLIICTVLYILIALVLTGMVSYKDLAVGDPLAFVFTKVGLTKISGIISFSAVIATASVLLIFQLGQPRIWMSMSRDGLLPKVFSRIHPKFHTPSFATIVTGFVVAIPALFLNLTVVTDLTSIGTLFAFVLVCGGVLLLPREAATKGRFHLPYINAKYIAPVVFIAGAIIFWQPMIDLFTGANAHENFPFFLFIILSAALTIASFVKNLSLIPVLGLLSCFYLMTQLGYDNWIRFIGWLVIGLVIYVSYGYTHSKLGNKASATHQTSVWIAFVGALLAIAGVFIFVHTNDTLVEVLDVIVAGCVGFLAVYLVSAAFFNASERKKPI